MLKHAATCKLQWLPRKDFETTWIKLKQLWAFNAHVHLDLVTLRWINVEWWPYTPNRAIKRYDVLLRLLQLRAGRIYEQLQLVLNYICVPFPAAYLFALLICVKTSDDWMKSWFLQNLELDLRILRSKTFQSWSQEISHSYRWTAKIAVCNQNLLAGQNKRP